jgi:hypothetical protein
VDAQFVKTEVLSTKHRSATLGGDVGGNAIVAEGHVGILASATGTEPLRAGVYGYSSAGGRARVFQGDLVLYGTVTESAAALRIEHPLEPETKYLYQSFVESPDMKSIYDGVVEIDAVGEAWVELPKLFEALNRDFSYQLTVIGRFVQIQTDEPGVKVSWQVTGIRQDPYAEAHRIPVEEDKPRQEVGRYLHPDLFGAPRAMAIDLRPGSR